MKKLLVVSLMAIAVFSSCKKNDDVSAGSFRPDEVEEDILPNVDYPHGMVFMMNNADEGVIIENVYTGVISDVGGKFPISAGFSTRMISPNLGKNTFSIVLQKTGTEGQMNIVDSDGTQHSKIVRGNGYEILLFEDVVVKEPGPFF
ncbi:MAG: hypothetical protein KF746_07955 [Chitinophagaceae bacterium]|nr:hypothetical protein [Chitinophagaceae bacterium]